MNYTLAVFLAAYHTKALGRSRLMGGLVGSGPRTPQEHTTSALRRLGMETVFQLTSAHTDLRPRNPSMIPHPGSAFFPLSVLGLFRRAVGVS